MCDRIVAIFDIGKSRSKLAILSADGSLAYEAERASATVDAGPYPSLDTDSTWLWMLQALRDSNISADVTDCVVVTHGATFALLEGDTLAVPVMDYEFDGLDTISAAYERARDSFGNTFSPSLPAGLNAGRQIFYVQRSLPDAFGRVSAIVPYPQYWAARLCGVVATEATSLGCHTDLWRPGKQQFSSLVNQCGWLGRMPPRRTAWDVLGTVLPDVASKSGLNPRCRIHCGIHDSNASYLRYLGDGDDRFCVVSTGTWVVCMASGHELDRLDAGRDMLANVDVFANPVPCARFMGGREFSEIVGTVSGDREQAIIHNLDDADRIMRHGSFALPSFTASGGPFPGRHGELVEPPQDVNGRRAMASLYCALMTDACLDNLDAEGVLIVEGRYIRDPVFVEALAHFRARQRLHISDDVAGTIGGAARLIGWPNKASASPPVYKTARPAELYQRYRKRWRSLLGG